MPDRRTTPKRLRCEGCGAVSPLAEWTGLLVKAPLEVTTGRCPRCDQPAFGLVVKERRDG